VENGNDVEHNQPRVENTSANDVEVALLEEAQSGRAVDQFNLGYAYKQGGDLPNDQIKAEKWLKLAADQGHADAQFHLGLLYEEQATARYSRVDTKGIAKMFFKAAAQGHIGAQLQLGLMYREGYNVRQDYLEAVKWFELASADGNAEAFYQLGLMNMLGQGVQKNILEAYVCFNLAAANGYKAAVDARKDVTKFLSENEIAQAQSLSREREAAMGHEK